MIKYRSLKDKKIIPVKILSVKPANFKIPNFVEIGDEVAVVDGEDFLGIIPKTEMDIYKNITFDFYIERILRASVLEEYKLENGLPLVIFSCKKAMSDFRESDLSELNDDFQVGRVIAFTDYSVIVKYKHLKTEILNRTFCQDKSILPSDILNIGDELMIKLDRIKKNGSRILTKPMTTIDSLKKKKYINAEDVKVGDIVRGVIDKTDNTLIYSNIGYELNKEQEVPVKVITYHPIPSLDQYCEKGVYVDILITKSDNFKIRGEIQNICLEEKFELIDDYRKIIKDEIIKGD